MDEISSSKIVIFLSLSVFDLALNLVHRVVHEALECPVVGLKCQGFLFVSSKEFDGGIALNLIGFSCCPFLIHIDSSHFYHSVQYLSCLLKLGS